MQISKYQIKNICILKAKAESISKQTQNYNIPYTIYHNYLRIYNLKYM